MDNPYLIQRCFINKQQKLIYENMGSVEFECGNQQEAMRALFAAGMVPHELDILIEGKAATIYAIVPGDAFDTSAYQNIVQKLAEDAIQLKEWINFHKALREKLGLNNILPFFGETQVWFDINNAVFFCIEPDIHQQLIKILESIREKWSEIIT